MALLWRTRMRASWRAAVTLVALVGLGGGVTLAVAAGARRTASANDAILRAANATDVGGSFQRADPDQMLPLLERLPDVDGISVFVGFPGRLEGDGVPESLLYYLGLWTDPAGFDRPFVLSGRLPVAPDEVMLNEGAAAKTGLRLGDRATLSLASPTSFGDYGEYEPVAVRVVGIGLLADEVLEDELATRPSVFLSRAATEKHLHRHTYSVVGLSLVRGDVAAVADALPTASPDGDETNAMEIESQRNEDSARVQAAIRPLLGALAGFAALAGLATVVVVVQAVGRLVRRRPAEETVLTALGCTRSQLLAVDVMVSAVIAVCGVAAAVGVAVAASPLFPIGPARRFKAVVGGFQADVTALAAGAALLVGTILFVGAAVSWRRQSGPRTARTGRAPGLLGSRPSSAAGVGLATGRPGAVTTIVGVGAGLAAVLASLTFTGSLDRLDRDPGLAGMTWDMVVRKPYTLIDEAAVLATARRDPALRRLTAVAYAEGRLGDVLVPAVQVRGLVGEPWPPVTAGRTPRNGNEILVGRKTLEASGRRIGDQVQLDLARQVELGPGPAPTPLMVTIVGTAVTPAVGQAGIRTPRLSEGVVVSPETVVAVLGEAALTSYVYLFDLSDRGDPARVVAAFPDGLPGTAGAPTEWSTSALPAEVRQATDARPVIWLGVGALGVAIVATVGQALLGSVRQRRRDYAVLKALGFTRGQVRATVLWQGGVVLAAALAGAVPVGIAAGRWLWIAFAGNLGIVVRPVVPALVLAGVIGLMVVAVQGAALVPATLARRTAPGGVLRVE